MSKREKSTLRFAVRNKNNQCSSVWRCWIHNEEIYLGVRDLSGAFKSSLHKSGSWQIGFTKEFSEQKISEGIKMPTIRHLDIWESSLQIAKGGSKIYQILIPSLAVCEPINSCRTQKKIVWVDGPGRDDKAITFSIILTQRELEFGLGITLVGRLVVNKEIILYVISSITDMPKLTPSGRGNLTALKMGVQKMDENDVIRAIVPCVTSDGRRFIIDTIIDPKSVARMINKTD